MDAILRDRLLPIVTGTDPYMERIREVATQLRTEEDESRREELLALLALLLLQFLLWAGYKHAEAVRMTIRELYGLAPPRMDVQKLVMSVFRQHGMSLQVAMQRDSTAMTQMAAIDAVVGTSLALVIKNAITAGLLSVGKRIKTERPIPEEVTKTYQAAREEDRAIDLAMVEAQIQRFRPIFKYIHTRNLEGICSWCMPNVGKLTYGDGSDGVPVPPIHRFCRCALKPVPIDEIPEDAILKANPVRELKRLKGRQLVLAVGPVRARLLKEGALKYEDLFTPDYSRMRTLEELGYSAKGRKLEE